MQIFLYSQLQAKANRKATGVRPKLSFTHVGFSDHTHVFTHTSCRLAAVPSKQTEREAIGAGKGMLREYIYPHSLSALITRHGAMEKRQQRCPSPAHIRSTEPGPRPHQSAGAWSKHHTLDSTLGQTHNNLYKIYGLNNEWEKHFEVIGCAQVPSLHQGSLFVQSNIS